MSSELNPLSIADAFENADWSGVSIGNKALLLGAIAALRAVPSAVADVPELVRYDLALKIENGLFLAIAVEMGGGEYVRHDQAVAMIAAKDVEIARLKQREIMIVSHATMGGTDGQNLSVNDISVRVTALRNDIYNKGIERAKAAEAKLAQIEKQGKTT